MSIIAILGIASEIEHLRDLLDVATAETTPVGTFWRGRWAGQEVILGRCAVGKINAAMALQWLVDHHSPHVLLNCGSSGAIAPRLRVGDVVIADRVVPHDVGVFLQRGFVITGNELPRRGPTHWRVFPADPRLVRLAREAAEGVDFSRSRELMTDSRVRRLVAGPGNPARADWGSSRLARVWVGPIASGDQVIFADRPKRWLHQTCGALAVENEGIAVAQVATAHGLPWLVLRGISDTADAEAAFDYTRLLRYADEGCGPLAWLRFQARRPIYLLRHPDTRTRRRRFHAGVQVVNTNVAALLENLLPWL